MKQSELLVMLAIVVAFAVVYRNNNSNAEGFDSGSAAEKLTYRVKNAYLNGVGQGNIGTGTAYQKISSNCTVVHVQGNLPEPQAALERDHRKKSACNCHCNGLYDCKCTGESGCKNYVAYISNPVDNSELLVGKLQKFRDGQYRISKKFTQPIGNYTKVVVRFDNEIPVLYGSFTDYR